ncbi:hypothetical protein NOM01_05960 [Sporolactobacillus sp. STSJ-5]|uniref:hypothetical protein n=1 Tax=Sporolactobacillus sp. STSJ-5 TaxID=2965076 RepID=UPI0021082B9E|nr:hypothetical protein [Sporolactobacillus sp. STSJ-5]MCQ2009543.1 hypothetical protein [Sporolactobacillus sp. STSJ-5]
MISRESISKRFVVICIVSASLLILLFSILLANNIGKTRFLGTPSVTSANGFNFNIENINIDQSSNTLQIKGWVFIKGESIDTVNTNIVLRNTKTGKCYQLPTQMMRRPDVAQQFKNAEDYSKSGFLSITKINKLDSSKYDILLKYGNDNKNILIRTNKQVII